MSYLFLSFTLSLLCLSITLTRSCSRPANLFGVSSTRRPFSLREALLSRTFPVTIATIQSQHLSLVLVYWFDIRLSAMASI